MKRRKAHLPPGCVGFKEGCRLIGFSPATGQRRLSIDPKTPALPPVHRVEGTRDRYFKIAEIIAFKAAGIAPDVMAMLARQQHHENDRS
jgi:hypothetical protein